MLDIPKTSRRRWPLAVLAGSALAVSLLVWVLALGSGKARRHQLDEALLEAIGQRNASTAAAALAAGANPNMRFDPSRVRTGDLLLRLSGSAQRLGETFRNGFGRRGGSGPPEPTVLMSAATGGSSDMVRLLLEKGAFADARDDAGYTALLYAAREGHHGAVSELLAHGADVQAQANSGVSALHLAQTGGQDDVVRLLRRAGAKP